MKLNLLLKRATQNHYDLNSIDWSQEIDDSKIWSPVVLSPLSYLPSYEQLSVKAKLRYNQLFSLGVCEQFIWFEHDVLQPILKKLLTSIQGRDLYATQLKTAIEGFYQEEQKHSEMFWMLLKKAEPGFYREQRFKFLNLNSFQSRLMSSMISRPDWFIGWIWFAIFMEERTLDYSRHYMKAQGEPKLDPLFSQVHRFHFLDEVRHVALDEHLLGRFYLGQSSLKKLGAVIMLNHIFNIFTSPRRISKVILRQLESEFQERDRQIILALKKELPSLKTSQAFQQMAFGPKTLPRSFELLASYPEFDRAWKNFHCVKKSDFTLGRPSTPNLSHPEDTL